VQEAAALPLGINGPSNHREQVVGRGKLQTKAVRQLLVALRGLPEL
jgi:hypothetical protein